jgi:RNA polymerase sigma-70 factor (ECF subfamily)
MTRMTARPTPASAPVPAPDDPSDEDLLARYARGDARAARELAERHGPRLLGYARRMLRGDSAEAEDVLQEAMLRLWRIAPEWDAGRARVGTWLYRVVTNLCIDRLRRRPQAALDTIAEPPDDRPGAEAGDALPDRQRQAILLRHFEGLSNPEIGAVMDIGVEAVESLLARGKRALVAALAGRRETLGYDDDTA